MLNLKELRLTRATEADLPWMQQLLQENQLPDSDLPAVVNDLMLAYQGSELIGIAGIEPYPPYGLLRSFVITLSFRGQGYGRLLCNHLIAHASWTGIRELYLLTTTAESFFLKMGFDRVERQTVPLAIQNTREFSELCPSIAICMKRDALSLFS
ncbi:MAG: GNAT family N-acetyltransferase [Cyanobacteria bacterium CRU_2_1]|nr:GNAT family N-acetyltransferase [Cyanobacteria bacterium CRU_2_1]